MAYTVIPTITTGDVATASWGNTYLKNNFAAGVPDIFTTDGDMAVATGSNAAERVSVMDGSNLVKRDRGGLEVALSAPGADRILMWDHSATAYAYLTAGTGLTISGTTMTAAFGLAHVVEDTSPQLGGNLDMQSRLLVGGGGSTGIAIDANGIVSMAAQPLFAAFNSATDANQTGSTDNVTVDFDTEIFDQNADFASDTFTAPVTGRYSIVAQVLTDGRTSASTTIIMRLTSSNGSWNRNYLMATGTAGENIMTAEIIDMDASDTVYVTVGVAGESSDVVGFIGNGTIRYTTFAGALLG